MKLAHCLTLGVTLLVSACTLQLAAAGAAPAPQERQAAHYRLIAVPLEETSPPIQKREPLPFKLLAPGSKRSRIVDKDGREVRLRSEGASIVSMTISPNGQWILLGHGDAHYSIASAETFHDIAKVPIRPDAPSDATVFEWFILDDRRLIGYADLPSLEPTAGLTASEADALPPRGTLVYIYIIATGARLPVEIDDSVPRPFGISTDPYGNLVISPLLGLSALGMKVLQIPEP